jgi:hypothetical protein
MIFTFKCNNCDNKFEKNVGFGVEFVMCPNCKRYADKQFHACTNVLIPSYFHTNKSDIFTDTEWRDLKNNPDISRV